MPEKEDNTAKRAGRRSERAQAKAERPTRRPVLRRWPRVAAGSVTAVVAVGLLAAGTVLPGHDATAQLAPRSQALPLGDLVASCAGPTRMLAGSDAGTDPQFSAASSSTTTKLSAVVVGDANGTIPGSDVESLAAQPSVLSTLAKAPSGPAAPATKGPVTDASRGRAAVVQGLDTTAVTVLRASPLNGAGALAGGAVVVSAGDGDLQGLAAATCQQPANDLWITGAATSVGRTAVLVLANPTQSPATVSLDLFGTSGPVEAAGARGIVVAPGASRSVVLSGLAPNQGLLTLHARSSGGAVTALVQQSVLRGLTPGGVDYLPPVQAPAQVQTIPGVRVGDPAAAAKVTAQDGYADAGTSLQVTVPGTHDSIVAVKAFGPTGQVPLPNGGVFTARAGQSSELPLTGLPAGTYSLQLSADAPVAAAVRIAGFTKAGSPVDFAQAPSAQRLGTEHLATLPGGAASTLVFTAPAGAGTVSLTPVSASGALGAPKDVPVPAGTSVSVDPAALLGSGTADVLISASGDVVYGTQLLVGKGSADVSVLPFSGASADSGKIAITTGY